MEELERENAQLKAENAQLKAEIEEDQIYVNETERINIVLEDTILKLKCEIKSNEDHAQRLSDELYRLTPQKCRHCWTGLTTACVDCKMFYMCTSCYIGNAGQMNAKVPNNLCNYCFNSQKKPSFIKQIKSKK